MVGLVGVNMAEKASKPPPIVAMKPVPMKLFATWEVDRTPSNCIPRLCSLTLSRLVVLKPLGSDIASIIIAVKMQSSKRTLRSNELLLPPSGMLDTELELNFSLQYPHFLKREGNKLHVMLQRRKRYKNRTILGYKTLAEGVINMSQVLQRQMDLDLDLCSEAKEKSPMGLSSNVVARVSVQALNSQPVDHEPDAAATKNETTDRVADFSDDEEEFSSNEDGEGEGSDSEPMAEDAMGRRARKAARGKIPTNARQRNLKQKFIALLKRFRVSEDLQGLDNDQEEMGQKLSGRDMDPTEIEDLFEELEDLSDSGPELDTMSISSTPKPSLRPFFSSSRSLLQETLNVPGGPQAYSRIRTEEPLNNGTEKGQDRLSDESSKKADSDSHPETWTDHEHSDPQQAAGSPPKSSEEKNKEGSERERERKSRLFARDRNTSAGKNKKQAEKSLSLEQKTVSTTPSPVQGDSILSEPRKALLEQLARVLPPDDPTLPDHVTLVSGSDPAGGLLAARLQDRGAASGQHKVVSALGPADVRATVTCLVGKIQKFCNTNAKPPPAMKVLLAGSDSFVNAVLRHYVEQFSMKPPDWQSYVKFLIVPLGSNSLARYLGTLDSVYAQAFAADSWKELLERAEIQKTDCQEMVNRVHRYLHAASATIQLPVAEAMVTYKEKSSDDESSQIFIPFVNDVRLGSPDGSASASVDLDESLNVPLLSGSPPSLISVPDKKERITPPSSPNINSLYISQNKEQALAEPLELQLDYWLVPGKGGDTPVTGSKTSKTDSSKSTLKTTFRALQVQRLPLPGETPTQHFLMSYSTKEKKQKIMRLGKKKEKEKEAEPKSQFVEGVSRLICSAKTQSIPLKGLARVQGVGSVAVWIDGTEWSGVKFFQLSAQWQTHIKHFPVTLFNFPEGGM